MTVELSPIMERFNEYTLAIYCPGCKMLHPIYLSHPSHKGPTWVWNEDVNTPTFSPSLLVRYPWGPEQRQVTCHSFIRDGQWQFLDDCTHELKGQTVPIPSIPDDWK